MFYGHTKSVKTVAFRPNDCSVFATGARDGKVLVWDIRDNLGVDIVNRPDKSINNCHPIHCNKTPTSASKRSSRLVPETRANSITGLIFQNDETLISCADGDGNIKIWDLRKTYSTYTKDPLPKQSIPYYGSSSKNGYTNLIFDKSRYVLFANCMDSVIYSFNITALSFTPLQRYVGHENSTFYIKSSLSPEGNFLLSGSSDEKAYIWNTKYSEPIVQLEGHSAEVTCASWCQTGDIKLITCSDDARHKIWRIGKEWPDSDDIQNMRGSARRFPPSGKIRRTLDQTPQSVKRKATDLLQLSSKKKCFGQTSTPSPRSGSLAVKRNSKRSLIDMLNGTLPTVKEENVENEPNQLNVYSEDAPISFPCEASTSKSHFSNDLIEGCMKLDAGMFSDEEQQQSSHSSSLTKYMGMKTPTKSPRKLVISPSPRKIKAPSPGICFDFPNYVISGDAPHLGLMSPPKKICKNVDWLTQLSIKKNVKPNTVNPPTGAQGAAIPTRRNSFSKSNPEPTKTPVRNTINSPIGTQGAPIPPRRNSLSKSNPDPTKTPVRCRVSTTLLNYFSKSTEKK